MDVKFRFRNNKDGLFRAIELNIITEVRRLISGGISVNIKDDDGWTPLMIAADKNNLDIVRLLVELGAELEIKNDDEETALMISVYSNSDNVSRYLINAGADPDVEDIKGRTSYEIAKELYPNQRFDYLIPKKKKIEKKNIMNTKNKDEDYIDDNDLVLRIKQNKADLLEKEILFNDFFSQVDKIDCVEKVLKMDELRNLFKEKFNTELRQEDIALYFGYNKKMREKFRRLDNGDFKLLENKVSTNDNILDQIISALKIENNKTNEILGEDILRKMGATWFVSYMYFLKVDNHHTNWDRISTFPSRISWFNSSRLYHKSWLFQILLMDDGRLDTNWIDLSAAETKKMAQEIISKCNYTQ